MVGQMFNYLHNAVDNDILSGEEINDLLSLKENISGETELDLSQGRTIKKLVDYFIKNSSKDEFSTLTGYEFSDLINLSSKINPTDI